jgi:hypothetical protein
LENYFSETKIRPAPDFFCPRLGFVNEPSPEGSVVDKTGSSPADAPKNNFPNQIFKNYLASLSRAFAFLAALSSLAWTSMTCLSLYLPVTKDALWRRCGTPVFLSSVTAGDSKR